VRSLDTAPINRIIRLVAPEFSGVADETVADWINLTSPLVGRRKFGGLYEQALALLTAHRMKLANVGAPVGEDPLGDIGGIGAGNLMRVANYSEGEVSIGFNGNMTQYTAADAELALTPYGIQYLNLRRMRIIPIVSAGEPNART